MWGGVGEDGWHEVGGELGAWGVGVGVGVSAANAVGTQKPPNCALPPSQFDNKTGGGRSCAAGTAGEEPRAL